MILSITIQKPTGEQFFELGAFLMNQDETKSDISVTRIRTFLNMAWVTFSDGRTFKFRGYPFLLIIKK